MTDGEIQKHKDRIDKMTQRQMASLWRFAPAGHPMFDSTLPIFDYFEKRFKELGNDSRNFKISRLGEEV